MIDVKKYLNKDFWLKKDVLFQVVGYLMLLIAFIIVVVYTNTHLEQLTDADTASELVLSNILAKEFAIISRTWAYSTELRVLNNQLVFTFYFLFIKDWHVVHMLGNVTCYLILLASLFFFCKQVGLKVWYPYIALLFMLPFSRQYFLYVLLFTGYVTHISISLCTIGLFVLSMKSKGKMFWVWTGINAVLAMLAGMGGLRQILILYLPLTLATGIGFFRKRDKEKGIALVYAIALTAMVAIGFLVNYAIFVKYFIFGTNSDLHYTFFSFGSFEKTINEILEAFGYVGGGRVFDVTALFPNAFALISIVFTIYCIVTILNPKNEYGKIPVFIALFTLCAFLCFFGIYFFTTMYSYPRHNIPILIFCFPVMFFVADKRIQNRDYVIFVLTIAYLILAMLSSMVTYNHYKTVDMSKDHRAVAEYLTQNGYENGYASFWNANVLTEFSNGQLEVWQIGDSVFHGAQTIYSIDRMYVWLQQRYHEYVKPEGKVFLIMTSNELKNSPVGQNCDSNYLIFESGNLSVFGFDSYEQAKSIVG